MLKAILVGGIALALLSSSAIAKEKSSALACAVDIKSKCGEVNPGEGRIRACVKEHMSEFSEPAKPNWRSLRLSRNLAQPMSSKPAGMLNPGPARSLLA